MKSRHFPSINKKSLQSILPSSGFLRPQIQKKQEADYPQISNIQAIPLVALTTLIMAYSGLFGVYPILLLYAMWLPRIFYKGRFILHISADIFVPVVFVFYCLVSTLWSNYPSISLHKALEFLSMLACVIVMSRTVSIEAFIKGAIVGIVLILVPLFMHGTYSESGLFGSKNQVGLFTEIGIFSAVLYYLQKPRLWEKMAFCIFPIMFFSVCLLFAHSASSVATLVLVLGVIYAARLISRFAPHRRKLALGTVIFLAFLVALAGFYLGQQDTLLQAMGKDTTLTGRTYLWSEGIKNGLNDPILGHGYSAFWVIGQPQAEKYWFEFFIATRTGFHFHNLYVQTFVDLGALGLLMMLFMVLSNCLKSFANIVESGATLNTLFCLGISFMFFARGFVEVDYLGPFGIGSMLFFSLSPRLMKRDSQPATSTKTTKRPLLQAGWKKS